MVKLTVEDKWINPYNIFYTDLQLVSSKIIVLFTRRIITENKVCGSTGLFAFTTDFKTSEDLQRYAITKLANRGIIRFEIINLTPSWCVLKKNNSLSFTGIHLMSARNKYYRLAQFVNSKSLEQFTEIEDFYEFYSIEQ